MKEQAMTADLIPSTDTATTDVPAYDVRVVRDSTTGAVAIVLDAVAAEALDFYLDGLGALHDIAGDDPTPDALLAADVLSAIRALLSA
jgi:hypothetical protein